MLEDNSDFDDYVHLVPFYTAPFWTLCGISGKYSDSVLEVDCPDCLDLCYKGLE